MEGSNDWGRSVREREGEGVARLDRGFAGLVLSRVGPVAALFLFFVLKLFYFIFCFAFYLLHFGSKLIQTTL
jgi:hypothetical protein